MHHEHLTPSTPNPDDQSVEGKLIPIYLPDKFHPLSEKEDARAARYDLSATGLSADLANRLAMFFDKYLQTQDPHTEEIVDFLWHYATQASCGDSETAAIAIDTILNNCQSLLELSRSNAQVQNATIANDARN